MKKIVIFFGLLLPLALRAQNPAPAKPQSRPIALTGATIHVGNGQVIENGTLVFDKGIITAIGNASTTFDRTATEVLNLTGKHIFPSLVSMGTTVGLQEIASVRATLDFQEVGEINPHVRALIAYNTDSEIIPTLRNTGILVSQAVPQGGLVSGQSSVFYGDGWNWEDAVLKKDDGVWLSWPPYLARSFNPEDFTFSIKKNEKRAEVIQSLRAYFADAKAYAEIADPAPVNLRLASMKNLFSGAANLYVRADYAKDIIEAVQFAKEMGVQKVVIMGGDESHKITGFLKENQVPVVLEELHRLPSRPDDDVYLPYELPARLHKAGVKVALSYGSGWWRTRNLAFQGGTAAGFGDLTPDEALQLVTRNPAEIMGVAQQVGTLEKGKHATLVVARGDLLDMRSNVIEKAYVKGADVNLDDKHKRLYEKYKEKYGH
ncbi:amidohydrolase [Rhabdobacter roseus]|uniref:Imidazolonepropionase-like amidohydrolase n=1 Tax=Rhabdobacter roseus TaxID=1655419 RepID=A0A840TQ93_9BACT|nr:amidohydrolase family protein [Rhabdobacter roseus]MBB5283722.1 imidazolonepropionase-like amidohydrolase [Rhabdobacter roseus]